VNGGTDAVFRFSDVVQHGFVPQHGDVHAFWLGVFTATQVEDTELCAKMIATNSVSETAILLNISCLLTRLRLFVEAGVRFLGQ
jgi:hypothetical protein